MLPVSVSMDTFICTVLRGRTELPALYTDGITSRGVSTRPCSRVVNHECLYGGYQCLYPVLNTVCPSHGDLPRRPAGLALRRFSAGLCNATVKPRRQSEAGAQ